MKARLRVANPSMSSANFLGQSTAFLFTKFGPSLYIKHAEISQCHASVSTQVQWRFSYMIFQLLALMHFGDMSPHSWRSIKNRLSKILEKYKPSTKSEYAAVSKSEERKLANFRSGITTPVQASSKFSSKVWLSSSNCFLNDQKSIKAFSSYVSEKQTCQNVRGRPTPFLSPRTFLKAWTIPSRNFYRINTSQIGAM